MTASSRSDWLDSDDDRLISDCDFHTYRASGPGGQKRNKTDSAVRLRHRPTDITVVATESRSQHENRTRALRRLRLAIALTVRVPPGRDAPGGAARTPDYIAPTGRLRINRRNPEYAHVVAEVLDTLHASRGRLAETAKMLGTSTAQLTRFLTDSKKLLAATNEVREMHGLRPLRP